MKLILSLLVAMLAFLALAGCVSGWKNSDIYLNAGMRCPRHDSVFLSYTRFYQVYHFEIIVGYCPECDQNYVFTLPIPDGPEPITE